MKASYAWIRELCPSLTATPRELADKFTNAGLEVEAIEEHGVAAKSCIVARVVSKKAHPTKDKLGLVTVDIGNGQMQEVVCGAPNVPDAGGLVVLAPLGAHLPHANGGKGMTMEKRLVAGVPSEGMLCSETELGLSEESDGILILSPNVQATPGQKLSDAIPGAFDTVLDIGLTPNRPDGLGHLGLAREAAALFDLPFAKPATPDLSELGSGGPVLADLVKIDVQDFAGCPHYAAMAVLGVTIARSPENVRFRLSALGVRPISNVVDITNLAMLLFGHPMHAFDLDRLRDGGNTIVVRRANTAETLVTLDGVERKLEEDDLLICDATKPLALAGVMGGGSSEVHAGTTNVIFECASFDPRAVRRSSRRHGLHTEASHRFERGIDPGDVEDVLAKATEWTVAMAGGKPADGIVEVQTTPPLGVSIRLDRAKLDALVGTPVPWQSSLALLERLGCVLHGTVNDESAEVRAPTHRPDLTRDVDLIDEIVRVRGMDAIPAILPAIRASRDVGGREELERIVRDAAVSLGLFEAVTFAFVANEDLSKVGADPAQITLQNPLSEAQSVMRTRLLPGLLHAASRARRHGVRDARYFTIGRTYHLPDPETEATRTESWPLDERTRIAILLVGDRAGWLQKPEPLDVWDAKAIAVELLERVTRGTLRATADERFAEHDRPSHLHPRGTVRVQLDGRTIGTMGPLHPDVLDAFELAAPALAIEIDLEPVRTWMLESTGSGSAARYKAIARFPASARDLAVVVKSDVAAGDILAAARQAAGDLAEDVALFDRFVGGAIPEGHASLALRVVYRAAERTLTDAEVDTRHAAVTKAVEAQFGAQLRG